MGAANAAAGFTQGFSVGASNSRTAVNDDMGARSQLSGVVAAATVAVILLVLTEPVQYLPKAVLGGGHRLRRDRAHRSASVAGARRD